MRSLSRSAGEGGSPQANRVRARPAGYAMLLAFTLLLGADAQAMDPCPERAGGEEALPATRADIQNLARRAFDGYRLRDNRVVRESRCDVERALPLLVESLGAADVSRVHLVYALDASMSNAADDEVRAYLVAARAADSFPDDVVPGLTEGEADDELLRIYEELVEQQEALLAAYAEPATALPRAWRATVRVNGTDAFNRQNGPYLMQVIGGGAEPKLSVYRDEEADEARIRYTRLHPVQAGMIGGAAALSLASLGLGVVYRSKAEDWTVSRDQELAGSALKSSVEDWQKTQSSNLNLNHAFLGTAAGFGAVTIGLGVWYAASF